MGQIGQVRLCVRVHRPLSRVEDPCAVADSACVFARMELQARPHDHECLILAPLILRCVRRVKVAVRDGRDSWLEASPRERRFPKLYILEHDLWRVAKGATQRARSVRHGDARGSYDAPVRTVGEPCESRGTPGSLGCCAHSVEAALAGRRQIDWTGEVRTTDYPKQTSCGDRCRLCVVRPNRRLPSNRGTGHAGTSGNACRRAPT